MKQTPGTATQFEHVPCTARKGRLDISRRASCLTREQGFFKAAILTRHDPSTLAKTMTSSDEVVVEVVASGTLLPSSEEGKSEWLNPSISLGAALFRRVDLEFSNSSSRVFLADPQLPNCIGDDIDILWPLQRPRRWPRRLARRLVHISPAYSAHSSRHIARGIN